MKKMKGLSKEKNSDTVSCDYQRERVLREVEEGEGGINVGGR